MKNDKVTETIDKAVKLSAELQDINNNFNLTDEYVDHLRQQVDQLKAHKARLNKALAILNELPSNLESKYTKVAPTPPTSRW